MNLSPRDSIRSTCTGITNNSNPRFASIPVRIVCSFLSLDYFPPSRSTYPTHRLTNFLMEGMTSAPGGTLPTQLCYHVIASFRYMFFCTVWQAFSVGASTNLLLSTHPELQYSLWRYYHDPLLAISPQDSIERSLAQ